MTLEEAKSILKQEKKVSQLYGREQCIVNIKALDFILNYIEYQTISEDQEKELLKRIKQLNIRIDKLEQSSCFNYELSSFDIYKTQRKK